VPRQRTRRPISRAEYPPSPARTVSAGSRAWQLAINPNTVHKAYRELEREGLVRARPGLGTFVTRLPSGTDPVTQARFLAELARWLRSARSAGLGPDDVEAIYRTAFRDCFAEGMA
jgi:GntR family transcriptional regulator